MLPAKSDAFWRARQLAARRAACGGYRLSYEPMSTDCPATTFKIIECGRGAARGGKLRTLASEGYKKSTY